jgi:hypothetical protein
VFSDPGLYHLGAELPDCRKGTVFVLAHEAAVAGHIGRQDGGKTALNGIL